MEDNPLWYKEAIIYQVHLKAFSDANGDGIGDFAGLTNQLDYLQDLGITAIWLLPFYPSPFKDGGYDISDYYSIHPAYGTIREFKNFLKEAHKRDIRVITELVLNHTSDQHPWFQRARRAPQDSSFRNYYVWSKTTEKYQETRIIFKDFETSNWTFDPIARMYYWHRFYHHQPDLNYDNPKVRREMLKVLDYWLEMEVDGLRLDALPYLFEREGTDCENLPETHQFIKTIRDHINKKYKNRMLLAEANQWPESLLPYFGSGDSCHMAFHFPVMPRLYYALAIADRTPILDILDQTPAIPEGCQWAVFLRNHDELTLEMVTEEERDAFYQAYAPDARARINLGVRRRLAPLLENHRGKIELIHVLLFSLFGTPIIYYGDEIGMGDNYYLDDRDGLRTPMQWNTERNAGFSTAPSQALYLPVITDPLYHYEAVNVETQERTPSSLLHWMKQIIALRNDSLPLKRGDTQFLAPENRRILAVVRTYNDEKVLVAVNLSETPQVAELNLSDACGAIPLELLSKNFFPMIHKTPYLLTFGPYGYYFLHWKQTSAPQRGGAKPPNTLCSVTPQMSVLLRRPAVGTPTAGAVAPEWPLPPPPPMSAQASLGTIETWEELFYGDTEDLFEDILQYYIAGCRWFAGKSQRLKSVKIVENIPLGKKSPASLLLIEADYADDPSETYLLPICFGNDLKESDHPHALIARLTLGKIEGAIYDAVYNEAFRSELLTTILRQRRHPGEEGVLAGSSEKRLRAAIKAIPEGTIRSWVLNGDQSNSLLCYADQQVLKLYRRLEAGVHPDSEIGQFLLSQPVKVPAFCGSLTYRRGRRGRTPRTPRRPLSEPISIGHLQTFVPNQGDAWRYTLEEIGSYFERVQSHASLSPFGQESSLALSEQEMPPQISDLIGSLYLKRMGLLGQRTAELHLALAANDTDPHFAPEPYTLFYQRSLYQSFRNQARSALQLLARKVMHIPPSLTAQARTLLERENEILTRYKILLGGKIPIFRIRIHGDYHLGQVLFTGNDFVITDFEGEPVKRLSERRFKRSVLRDIAGMLRSFHYAAYKRLWEIAPDNRALEPWAGFWSRYVGSAFLRSYRRSIGVHPILPGDLLVFEPLLNAFILNKAFYELEYELNYRPDWVGLPLMGVLGSLL